MQYVKIMSAVDHHKYIINNDIAVFHKYQKKKIFKNHLVIRDLLFSGHPTSILTISKNKNFDSDSVTSYVTLSNAP